jgi:hypothetical protein
MLVPDFAGAGAEGTVLAQLAQRRSKAIVECCNNVVEAMWWRREEREQDKVPGRKRAQARGHVDAQLWLCAMMLSKEQPVCCLMVVRLHEPKSAVFAHRRFVLDLVQLNVFDGMAETRIS